MGPPAPVLHTARMQRGTSTLIHHRVSLMSFSRLRGHILLMALGRQQLEPDRKE